MQEKNDKELTPEKIRRWLAAPWRDSGITVFPELASTNTYAKECAAAGISAPAVIIAEMQTAGRGRLGRSFYSPASSGLYMSVILRPEAAYDAVQFMTVAAAVAVCRAVEKLCPAVPGIKWVNDIFIGNKKICGILAEAAGDLQRGMVESMIVGVGINVTTDDFPEALQNIAGALPGGERVDRARLAAEFLNAFLPLAAALAEAEIKTAVLAEYKKRSCILGRTVTFTERGTAVSAVAEDINPMGNLIVRRADGSRAVLQSGEISVKINP